jgi:hypothetical protein
MRTRREFLYECIKLSIILSSRPSNIEANAGTDFIAFKYCSSLFLI